MNDVEQNKVKDSKACNRLNSHHMSHGNCAADLIFMVLLRCVLRFHVSYRFSMYILPIDLPN